MEKNDWDWVMKAIQDTQNHILVTTLIAKIQRSYYDSLLGQGFDDEQAMSLLATTQDSLLRALSRVFTVMMPIPIPIMGDPEARDNEPDEK